MKRYAPSLLPVVFFVLCLSPCAGWADDSVPATDELRFVVEIGNRMYPDWNEIVNVKMRENFYLGDTEFTARVERFVPDFRISEGGNVLSHSNELDNPAVHVFVYGDSAATDSTWAFQNFPPHFSPRSFFIFRLKTVEGYLPPDSAGSSVGEGGAIKKEEDGDG